MIYVTRLNGTVLALNEDLVETIEETPDTVITLSNGNRYIVREPCEVLLARVIEFRRRCQPLFGQEEKVIE